ncbi:MAG: flagellar hook-length control protein FliK [Planctomycetota bacterium]|nr:flagellar hook-length control protein FliK [Planctomycetota bacterium]
MTAIPTELRPTPDPLRPDTPAQAAGVRGSSFASLLDAVGAIDRAPERSAATPRSVGASVQPMLRDRSRKELQAAHDIAESRDTLGVASIVPPDDTTTRAEERLRSPGQPGAHDDAVDDQDDPARAEAPRDRSTPRPAGDARPARADADGPRASDAPQTSDTPTRAASLAPPSGQRAPAPHGPPPSDAGGRVGATDAVRAAAPRADGPALKMLAVRAVGATGPARPGAGVALGTREGPTQTTRAGARAPAAGPPRAQLPEALPQVVRGLALALRQGGGTVSMKLNPEHLGSVSVRLHVDAGEVRARIETTDESARQLLAASAEDLRAALEARGLRVERIDIGSAEDRPPDGWGASGDAGRERGSRQDAAPGGSGPHPSTDAPLVDLALPPGASVRVDEFGRLRLEAVA